MFLILIFFTFREAVSERPAAVFHDYAGVEEDDQYDSLAASQGHLADNVLISDKDDDYFAQRHDYRWVIPSKVFF